jgi:putative ABC transport system ATP-binding protein
MSEPHLRALGAEPSGEADAPRAAARAVDGSKIYGEGETAVRALDDVTVEFAAARFSAVMGPSGSGKSTLMHCLAGLDQLSSGHAYVGDADLTTLSEKQLTLLRRDRIGFVFQAFNLVPTLTGRENVTLPLDIAGRKPDEEWLGRIVDTLGIAHRMDHRPNELSGGEQQRIAAARALVGRPEIIFADEPTGNLDSKSGRELLGFMRSAVSDLHQTIVMVTHDPNAAAYADRVVFLADGRVVDSMEDPTAERIIDSMKSLGD